MTTKSATLYRMVSDKHICPFGLKTKALLRRQGYKVEDKILAHREDIDAFKAKHDVTTTPQTFIGGERVGGYEELRRHFGLSVKDKSKTTYVPVMVIFAVAALISICIAWLISGSLEQISAWDLFTRFIAVSMILLALQKLRDIDSFANTFLGYDLLARKWVRYAYIYPFVEAAAGFLMLANILPFVSGPGALFIGTIGAISVFNAVYVQKRELKCACVGGNSNVPLGFVSLTENLMMMFMGVAVIMMAV